jgi:hypothetical protein
MYNTPSRNKTLSTALAYLGAVALCILLTACDVNISVPSNIGGPSRLSTGKSELAHIIIWKQACKGKTQGRVS